MRSLLARLAVLGALAVSMSACGGGTGSSLPFAGEPNSAGGSPGTIQTGANSQMLLRFIQGSPDVATPANPNGIVDVCIDNLSLGVIGGTAAYGSVATSTANTGTLVSVPGSIPHTIAVYPTLGTTGGGFGGGTAGAECATAPGPYLGTATLAVTTLVPPANANVRWTIVLGGTHASNTFGFYVFAEPTFAIAPAGYGVTSHNAAPAFSKAAAAGVGFGTCSATVTPCGTPTTLAGAGNVTPAKVATTGSAPTTVSVTSGINSIPAGFYDGKGVPAGAVVPITSIVAPNAAAGQPYILDLYAIDGLAGGLNLVPVAEQTLGYGF
jgi:hypothetical protein